MMGRFFQAGRKPFNTASVCGFLIAVLDYSVLYQGKLAGQNIVSVSSDLYICSCPA